MRQIWICVLVALATFAAFAAAAKVTLKDGSVVEGEVKKLGGSYSIKTADGQTRLVPGGDVVSIDDPTGRVADPSGAAGAAGAGGAAGAKPQSGNSGGVGDFAAAQRAAESSSSPVVAVTVWQKYIDDHPGAADLEKAKSELKRWQAMAEEGAEKIKGKWVSGEELRQLRAKVDGLNKEAADLLENNQTLKGIDKLQEVIKIYPASFDAHFTLGFFYLVKGGNQQYDKAIASLETATKLKPNSPAAYSNLAIAYNFRRNYEKAVLTAFKAAELEDSREIVQNLVNAINYAPPGMRANNSKVRTVMDQSRVMMAKHGIGGPSQSFAYVRPKREEFARGGEDKKGGPGGREGGPPGVVGSGTGFFITEDGYIMTNRHVAAGGDRLIVRFSDGTQKVAEKILVDDKQDIAILKIKSDKPTPAIRLAAYDSPPVGTDVTVMGFPLGAMLGGGVKITRGVVTSFEDTGPDCDVIVDAQVNPGNSGGPMIDKNGNLMALVAMKTFADATVSSYGLGISTGRLRKFFEQQKATLKLTLPPPDKVVTALNTEEIAGKFKPATVMILIISGDLPEGLKAE
ncbi:MAG TPA: trypsin-like peptidase domain-containing protein [Tepidisphaeraceae bacterium]|jgi:hypothetical protein